MNILVCDDDKKDMNRLCNLIKCYDIEYDIGALIYCYDSGTDLLAGLEELTAYINYAIEGYKVRASRFLIKDDLEKTIAECMDNVCAEIYRNRESIIFSCVEGDVHIRLSEILYVEVSVNGTYRFNVMFTLACPRISLRLLMSKPSSTHLVAKVCLSA